MEEEKKEEIELVAIVKQEEKPKDLNIFQSERLGAGSKGPGEK